MSSVCVSAKGILVALRNEEPLDCAQFTSLLKAFVWLFDYAQFASLLKAFVWLFETKKLDCADRRKGLAQLHF